LKNRAKERRSANQLLQGKGIADELEDESALDWVQKQKETKKEEEKKKKAAKKQKAKEYQSGSVFSTSYLNCFFYFILFYFSKKLLLNTFTSLSIFI